MNNSSLFLLISVLFLGISNIFFEKSVKHVGPINTTMWYYIFGLLLSSLFYFFIEKPVITNYTVLKWPFLVALFLVSSVFLFNISLQKINITIASTVRSLAFIITILLNFYLSKESLTSKQLLGMILGISSIILMQ